MSFDWNQFLDQRGIEYTDRGPSTSRGNIYVHCPWCGDSDQGKHLGISTEGRGWGCWRNKAHRGRSPQRLVQGLLGCSWPEAATIVGKRVGGQLWGDENALGKMLAGFEERQTTRTLELKFPFEFRPLKAFPGNLFHDYLYARQFGTTQIRLLAKHFNLRIAATGEYRYRLIIPIYDEEGRLVTWTGRAVNEDPKIRYKTLTADPANVKDGDPIADGPITDYLFDLPNLMEGGKFLVIVEGPLDALKLTLAAGNWGARVTCLFGKSVSDAQLNYLADLAPLYDATFLMLDPEATMDALRLQQHLAFLGVKLITPPGEHDPGEFTADEVTKVFNRMEKVRRG